MSTRAVRVREDAETRFKRKSEDVALASRAAADYAAAHQGAHQHGAVEGAADGARHQRGRHEDACPRTQDGGARRAARHAGTAGAARPSTETCEPIRAGDVLIARHPDRGVRPADRPARHLPRRNVPVAQAREAGSIGA